MRSRPRARTLTRFTKLGNRMSAGNQMAWLRLLVNTVLLDMVRLHH